MKAQYSRFKHLLVNRETTMVHDGFWSLGASILDRGGAFLTIFIVSRLLGREALGDVGLIFATVQMIAGPISYGFGTAGTRAIAEHWEADPQRVFRILILSLGVCVVFLLIAGLFFTFGAQWLATHVFLQPRLRQSLGVAPLSLAGELFRQVSVAVFGGFRAFRERFLSAGVFLIATVLFIPPVALLLGVPGVMAMAGLIGVFSCGVGMRVLWRRIVAQRVSRQPGQTILRELGLFRQYALPAALSSLIGGPVTWYAQTLLVRIARNTKELAPYTVGNQVRMTIVFLPTIVSSVLIPRMVQVVNPSVESNTRSAQAVLTNIGVSVLISCALGLMLALLSPWVAHVFGAELVPYAGVLAIMSWVGCLNGISHSLGAVIMSRGSMWIGFASNAVWSSTLLIFSISLIPTHGVIGLGDSLLLSYIVTDILQLAYICLAFPEVLALARWYFWEKS